VRAELVEHRHRLTHLAACLYPDTARVGTTDLLCREAWLPSQPMALDDVVLSWAADAPAPAVDGTGPAQVRPVHPAGHRYATYAEAVADLDPPALLDNRVCYRLLRAGLGAGPAAQPGLCFTQARYFDAVNLGHAVAHELAAACAGSPGGAPPLSGLPLRELAGDPCDLPRRPAIPAITTLTLRRTAAGEATFVLHWRDPAKVNHAGGLYQVMPVGIFQPLAGTPAAVRNDFSLWRCMTREFSEEFLGGSEVYPGSGGVLDYDRWPFYRRLTGARRAGKVTVHCLGVGVDPLTFATDILTVAVFDGETFDSVFEGLVALNAEGRVVAGAGSPGIPFTASTVGRFGGGGEPMQAAGAAVLQLAWRYRRQLLG